MGACARHVVRGLRGCWLGLLLSLFIMFVLNSVRVAPGVRSALAVAVSVCACGPTAWAAPVGGELDPLVVTATRSATRVSQLVADVTVIDHARLQAAAGQTLFSLLAEEAGLQFASNGGLGKAGSVYVRGGESRHTLVLIDGVRQGSATLGSPVLTNIPLSAIERIEIVRGPMSGLYGADAAAGVIQIFTRQAQPGGWQPAASLTLGTDDFVQVSAGLSGGSGPLALSLSAQHQSSLGNSSSNPNAPFDNHHPDRDGFAQKSLALKGALALQPGWKLELNALKSIGHSDFDDGVDATDPQASASQRQETTVLGVQLSARLNELWKSTLKWGQSEDLDDTEYATQSWLLGSFKTRQTQWGWTNQVNTPAGEVLAGVESLQQEVASSQFTYDQQTRTIDAVFLGLHGERDAHAWQFNVRRDRNSQFGGETTGSAAYGWRATPHWRLGASIGTSFVAPSFNQLYYPDYGSPGLVPERGVNRELSVRWQDGVDSVRVTWFRNRIRSFIQSGATVSNVPRAEMTGVSLSAQTAWDVPLGRWSVQGVLDWLEARNELTSKKLALRADHSAMLRTSLERGSSTYSAYLKANDGAYSDGANTDALRVRGFGWVGVSAQWRVHPKWQLGVRADNLTDRKVETQRGYNQPERQVFLTLSLVPGL